VETKDVDFAAAADDGSGEGVITGYLSTFGGEPDLQGDRVHKNAFLQTIKDARSRRASGNFLYLWPLCFNHDMGSLPAGGITDAWEDSKGLVIRAELNLGTQAGRELYNTAKARMITSLSIGYRTIKAEWTRGKKGEPVRELFEIALIEGSVVNTPANPNAQLLSVKAQGGYSMPTNKDFATNYHDEQVDDWACADWYDLSGALQQSVRECFSSGGDPMAALESDVIPAFLSALRAYVQEGVSLGYVPDQDEQMYPSMMSAGAGYDEKAGRTLSAANHAVLSRATRGISSQVGTIQSALERERANSLAGFPVYGSASARPEFSSKAMSQESHTQISGATTNIMTHVRSITSMQASARRQNSLRGFDVVHPTQSSSAPSYFEQKEEEANVDAMLALINNGLALDEALKEGKEMLSESQELFSSPSVSVNRALAELSASIEAKNKRRR